MTVYGVTSVVSGTLDLSSWPGSNHVTAKPLA